jgi:YfdX protein
MTKNIIPPLAIVGACVFVFSTHVTAAATAISAAAVANATIPLSAEQKTHIRALVASALERTARARQLLKNKQTTDAVDQLIQVGTLLDLAAAARPTGEINALLAYLRTKLVLEDNRQALPELLPLEAALQALPASAAVNNARRHLSAAKTALENQDQPKASAALQAMTKALVIDQIDFPLVAARDDLNTARTLLQDNSQDASTQLSSLDRNLLLILNGIR